MSAPQSATWLRRAPAQWHRQSFLLAYHRLGAWHLGRGHIAYWVPRDVVHLIDVLSVVAKLLSRHASLRRYVKAMATNGPSAIIVLVFDAHRNKVMPLQFPGQHPKSLSGQQTSSQPGSRNCKLIQEILLHDLKFSTPSASPKSFGLSCHSRACLSVRHAQSLNGDVLKILK